MLTTKEQKEICKKYSKRNEEGHKQCNLCPLCISAVWKMCHANSHYDPEECEYVFDNFDNEKHDGYK